jgi:hypothetical protein
MAFRRGRSIVSNANCHKSGKYFVRIDFKDFFPSIKFVDFIHALNATATGQAFIADYSDSRQFVERICFGLFLELPIGYVTSPVISNLVMREFDAKVYAIVASNEAEFGKATVTRYADDIVFSSDRPGACRAFLEKLSLLVPTLDSPTLTINSKKTTFTSKAAGSAIVTGLRVCPDGHITIPRKQKDETRLLLSLLAKGTLKPEHYPVLRGHLSYVRSAAPAFFSKLCLRYVHVIDQVI